LRWRVERRAFVGRIKIGHRGAEIRLSRGWTVRVLGRELALRLHIVGGLTVALALMPVTPAAAAAAPPAPPFAILIAVLIAALVTAAELRLAIALCRLRQVIAGSGLGFVRRCEFTLGCGFVFGRLFAR